MLDDQEGDALPVDVGNPRHDRLDQARIDAGGGFVEEDDRRIGHHHPGELEEFSLSAGKDARRLVGKAVEGDEFEERHGAFEVPVLLATDTARGEPVREDALAGLALGGDEQILDQRHLRKGLRNLEGAPEPATETGVLGFAFDGDAVEEDLAARRLQRARDEVEERCLPGSVRTDHPNDLAARDRHGHGVDGRDAAKMS